MNVENLVDSILSDQIQIADLNLEQMEALVDYMRKNISTIENNEYREALLILVDAIEIAAENRFGNEAAGDWEDIIKASMSRGNTYFELENYVMQ
jgi:hypothetical protein